METRWILIVTLASTGCGRFGFDMNAGATIDGASPDGVAPDCERAP